MKRKKQFGSRLPGFSLKNEEIEINPGHFGKQFSEWLKVDRGYETEFLLAFGPAD